jgi:hypothetical protein
MVSGGYGLKVTPVPIPNTKVKLQSADGTALETVWKSRSPPGKCGWIAQSVEQRTENPRVPGSIPGPATNY